MSLIYQLSRVVESPDTVVRVIRDDVNGSIVEITSAGIAARIHARDLIKEINRLEEDRQKASKALEDGVNE